jgi:hypothetical protein
MTRHNLRSTLKRFLQGVSPLLFALGGLSFLFGGRAIHEFEGIDRTLAEIIGLGLAFLGLILGMVGKYKIEDIEWQEQNEEAEKKQPTAEKKTHEWGA